MKDIWSFDKYKGETALLDEYGNHMSYSALQGEGRILTDIVGRRCLIFCLCRNEIGSIFGYVSFLNARIVPVLLNAHLERGLLDNLLEVYRPK